jgi:hypothetical protein
MCILRATCCNEKLRICAVEPVTYELTFSERNSNSWPAYSIPVVCVLNWYRCNSWRQKIFVSLRKKLDIQNDIIFVLSSWFRRYAASLKVACSKPDKAIDFFFNLPYTSSCTMALGFTQPLTEISTRKYLYFWAQERCRCIRLTSHPRVDCLHNLNSSTFHNPLGLHGLLRE